MSESINPYESETPDAASESTEACDASGATCNSLLHRLRPAIYGFVGLLAAGTAVAYAAPETLKPLTDLIPDSVLLSAQEIEAKEGQSCCATCPSHNADVAMAAFSEGESCEGKSCGSDVCDDKATELPKLLDFSSEDASELAADSTDTNATE